jgi:hypothetical protein
MQEALIQLNGSCDTVEVIILYGGSCYMGYSSGKIDRLERRNFNRLPDLYSQAYDKRLFIKKQPCYSREYVSCKPALDRIEKERIEN